MSRAERTVLVSFLGAGSAKGYQHTTYRFRDGDLRTATFFGCAAVEHLQATDTPIHRWVVLGTSGSAWSTISEGAERSDGDVSDALLEALESIEIASLENRVDDAMLASLEPLVSSATGVPEVRLRVIPRGRDDEEAMRIAAIVADSSKGLDRLHIDLTHGFRHLPLIAMVTAFGLRWSDDLQLGHLLYAAFEDRQDDGIAPVVDLAACQEMAADTAALAAFRTTGRAEPLARMLPDDAAESLTRASFLETVGRVGEARRPATAVNDAVADVHATSPIRRAGLEGVERTVAWSSRRLYAERLREQAAAAIGREDWSVAAMRCYEAILLAATRRRGGQVDPMNYGDDERRATQDWISIGLDKAQKDVYHQVRILRNSIVHGTRPGGKGASEVTAALDDPTRTRLLLEEGLSLLDTLLEDTSSSSHSRDHQ